MVTPGGGQSNINGFSATLTGSIPTSQGLVKGLLQWCQWLGGSLLPGYSRHLRKAKIFAAVNYISTWEKFVTESVLMISPPRLWLRGGARPRRVSLPEHAAV